ncbi:LysM peptidoglycan-binding domain-containing protein [Streptosporangium roseum]|uniref:LysM peptidoglycan-binding domain-containing protein n=1 Tax=Streptosporangium roseum TaxID=2001 RepID=UPI0005BE2570|nr:hypothetical protein [Streptosporangium roseum]
MSGSTSSSTSSSNTSVVSGGYLAEDPGDGFATDVTPAWGESLPAWADTLIALLSAGQMWPDGSESTQWRLRTLWHELAQGLDAHVEEGVPVIDRTLQKWDAPPTDNSVANLESLYSPDSGVPVLKENASAYAAKLGNFALETQYSKLSINVAFWISLIAISIGLVAVFFTGGLAARLIVLIAKKTRWDIDTILRRLAAAAGRSAGARAVLPAAQRVAAASNASTRTILSSAGRKALVVETVEESTEEGVIEGKAQGDQIKLGTRDRYDSRRIIDATIGGAVGGIVGMKAAPGVSRMFGRGMASRGFPGRTLQGITQAGVVNIIASAAGGVVVGLGHGRLTLPTGESSIGAFAGAAGRYGSLSPFNGAVIQAVRTPVTTFQSGLAASFASYDATTAANTTNLATATTPPPDPASSESSPSGASPAGTPPTGGGPTVAGGARSTNGQAAPGGQAAPAKSAPAAATQGAPAGSTSAGQTASGPSAQGGQTGANPSGPGTAAQGSQGGPAQGGQSSQTGSAQGGQAASAQGGQTGSNPSGPGTAAQGSQGGPAQGAQGSQAGSAQGNQTGSAPVGQGTPGQSAPAAPDPSASGAQGSQSGAAQGSQAAPAGQSAPGPSAQTASAAPDPSGAGTATQESQTGASGQSAPGPSAQTAPVQSGGPVPVTATQGAATTQSAPATQTNTATQSAPATQGGQSTASSPTTTELAQSAMAEVMDILTPDAQLMAGGSLRLPRPDGSTVHLPAAPLRLVRERLETRAADGAGPHRLRAEAAAWLGIEIARAADRPRLEGAIQALHWLAEASPETGDAALRVATEIVMDNPTGVDRSELTARAGRFADTLVAAANEPVSTPVDEHGALRPGRQVETAEEIARKVEEIRAELAGKASKPAGSSSLSRPSRLTELSKQVRELTASLSDAETGLKEREKAKNDGARAAEKSARDTVKKVKKAEEAERKGEKLPGERDRRAPERRRQARAEALLSREEAARDRRIAHRYGEAADQAKAAREAFKSASDAMRRLAAESRPGPAAALAAEVAGLVREANSRLAEYQEALKKALPPKAGQAAGFPAGDLPYLTALTERINKTLAREKIAYRFTAAELEGKLRAEFHQLVSGDGAVLRVGDGRDAEIRVKLRLSDLVEVLAPEVLASELMLGRMRQGNQAVSVSIGANTGTAAGVDVPGLIGSLIKMLPEHNALRTSLETVLPYVSLEGGVSHGSGESNSGKATSYVTGGGVTDNRGTSTKFSADALLEVEIRTPKKKGEQGEQGWRSAGRVTEGSPGDATHAEVWISHAHIEHGPEKTVQLRFDQGKTPPLPEAVQVISMTGLEEANTKLLAELGPELAAMGSMAQHEIRTMVVEELPNNLPKLVNNPDGIRRTITADGGAVVEIQAKAELRWIPAANGQVELDASAMGTPSTKQLGEKLGVSFSEVSGGRGDNRSWNANAGAGVKFGGKAFNPEIGPFDMADHKGLSAKAGANGSYGRSRSGGMNVGGTSIVPIVGRESGHNQAGTFKVVTTFTVTVHGESKPRAPITETLDVTAQMPETDAYNAGFPVDEAMIQRDIDGSPTFRDDLVPEPPPGRKDEPASWQGEGPHQVRTIGMGHAEVLTDLADMRRKTKEYLRGIGMSDPDVMADVDEQLSELRLGTDFNQLVKDGILVRVTDKRSGRRPQQAVLRVRVPREWGNIGYVGHGTAKTVVTLYIGSDTGSSSSGMSTSGSGGVAAGAEFKSGDGESKFSGDGGYGRNGGRSSGDNEGLTTNNVLLAEGRTTTAESKETARILIDHLKGDETVRVASEDVRVVHRMPAGMLAAAGSTGPSATFQTPGKLLDRARPWAVDLGVGTDVLNELAKKMGIPRDSEAYYAIAQFLSDSSLLSHTQFLQTPYDIEFVVESAGARPRRWSVSISGEVGDSRHITTGEMVDGDINLTLGSHGTSSGKRSGGGLNGSVGGGVSQAENPTTGGGAGGSRSTSRSTSTGRLPISGLETLGIDVGDQALFAAGLTTTVTVTEVGTGKTETVTAADGTYMYLKPERDVLHMYARGEMPLPLDEVADAVERFLYGHLTLRRETQALLVERYLRDMKAARLSGAELGLAAEHTPKVLFDRLMVLFGNHNPDIPKEGGLGRRLAVLLASERRRAATPDLVELAESVRKKLGQSLPTEIILRYGKDGPETDLHRAILDAIEVYAPGLLRTNPVLRRGLFSGFAGRNWLGGKLSNMLSRAGFVYSPTVRADLGNGTIPPVRVQMDFGDGPVELIAHHTDQGIIIQRYIYNQLTVSESSGTTYGGNLGVNGSVGSADINVGTSGSGDVSYSHSGSASRTKQLTELQRIFNFGVDEVRHALNATITVGDENGARPPVVVKLEGQMTRLVASDLVQPEQSQRVPDPRPVKLPKFFMVDGVEVDGLPEAVQAVLADDRLLGKEGAREVLETLERDLSQMRQAASFRQMLTPEGSMTIRFTDPRKPGKVVELTLRVRPQDMHVTVTGRKNTEIGWVNRIQHISERVVIWSRKLSIGKVSRFFGLSRSKSKGWSISVQSSVSGGNRTEISVFQKGTAASVEVPVVFDVTAEVTTVKRGRVETGLRIEARDAATGQADITMFERDLRQTEAGRGAEGRRRWGWNLGDPAVTRTTGTTERPGWRARWRSGPPAATAPSLDLDTLTTQATDAATAEGKAGVGITPDVLHRKIVETARESLAGRWTPGTPIPITATASAPGQMGPVTQARLLARGLRTDVLIELREPDGTVHRYRATPKGKLYSEVPDGGFASAFATLHPDLVTLADQAGVNLRVLHNGSPEEGDFAGRVREALTATAPAAPSTAPAAAPSAPSTAPAAVPQSPAGPAAPQQPSTARPSGSTFQPGATGSVPARAASAPRQGVIRRFLLAPLTGTSSEYVSARYNEYRHLAERWQKADTAIRSLEQQLSAPGQGRTALEEQLDALAKRRDALAQQLNEVAEDLRERGQVPPVPPWEAGPQTGPGGALASLLNRSDGETLPPSHWESQFWDRMRRLSNTTGLPEEEAEEPCLCPPGEPCVCGRRPQVPGPRSGTPSPSPSPTPSPASPSPSPSPSGDSPSAKPSQPEKAENSLSADGHTVTTGPDSTLWEIAEEAYGDGRYWKDIWERNREKIGSDPGALPVDLELVVPDRPKSR